MSIATTTNNTPAPAFFYNDQTIQAAYSFAEYTDAHRWSNP